MGDFDDNMTLALETLKRLSSHDMPTTYRHRHATAAGAYHALVESFCETLNGALIFCLLRFSAVSNQQSCLEILCRTFRHERLVLVLENSTRYHPAKSMPSVRIITCRDSSRLVEKLEQALQQESIESSEDESVQDYSTHKDYSDQDDDSNHEDYYAGADYAYDSPPEPTWSAWG
jgi:hypothetical protein